LNKSDKDAASTFDMLKADKTATIEMIMRDVIGPLLK
jgi:hypothetical protein